MKSAALGAVLLLGLGSRALAVPPGCDQIDLDQGWTHEEREEFWFTSQGSRLMPYSWFLALEVADPSKGTLFRDPSSLDRYGYIRVGPSDRNPDGLPIGFARDVAASGEEYVGFTCAACHTGSLNIGGQRVIVEGGQGTADFWTFLADAVGAVQATDTMPEKFDRFAKRVLKSAAPSDADLQKLHQALAVKRADLEERLDQNMPESPFGYGRTDAFGHIFNRVLAQDLQIPGNARPPAAPPTKAPVSYPFLWDTPQHDLVQWNGSAPNAKLLGLGPLGRNVGEVLGVFGELEVKPNEGFTRLFKQVEYTSSARLPNLIRLESMVSTLWSPAWPKDCLPLAGPATLERGRAVYKEHCEKCHALLRDPERKSPDRKITAQLSSLAEVKTDPTMAENFAARTASTGMLKGAWNVLKLSFFGDEASGQDLLVAAVNGVLLRGLEEGEAPVTAVGVMINPITDLKVLLHALAAASAPRYKARPLNGIWATAPYLHNGSVPTLADLLKPGTRRPDSFPLGGRDFDPEHVGLVRSGEFQFDTTLKGNLRTGHDYGTELHDEEKQDLLEFLKAL